MTVTNALPVSFVAQSACWICGAGDLRPVAGLRFELSAYANQDPELAAYTGARLTLCRCGACGFAQPEALPALTRYFDRMYDQRWSSDWMRAEHETGTKDMIFTRVLDELDARVAGGRRRLLDVGAHTGRFIALARARGWDAEGLEVNPQTCAYAARRTGARIRRLDVLQLDDSIERFDAVTVTDVLEHIPEPRQVLRKLHALIAPGGSLAVKVPAGPAQIVKERWRARVVPGYEPTLADNLVHVSHFSPRSLRAALELSGFSEISVRPGAPELPDGAGFHHSCSRVARRALFAAARVIPGGVELPLSLNLQAFALRP